MPYKSPYHSDARDWSPSSELGFASPGPKDVFVYVLKVRTANIFKIGISNDLTKRIPALERDTGYSLEKYGASIKLFRFQARALEAVFHSIFFERRIHGEFFELTRKEFIDGIVRLSDFGFGTPEQYLGSLLPTNAGTGDNSRRMKIGYARLQSVKDFPSFQRNIEIARLQRCYVDYIGQRKQWRMARLDLREGDCFYLYRKHTVSKFLVYEEDKKTRLRPLNRDFIFI